MAGRIGDTLNTSPAVKCIKFLLIIFNAFFFISGIAVLALGIWIKVDLHGYSDLGDVQSSNPAWVLIAVGLGILIFSVAACACTMKGVSYLLYAYAFVLVLVFIVEISVAISAFVLRDEIKKDFKTGLDDSMKKYSSDKDKKEALDNLQSDLKCCGSDKYTDWFSIDWEGHSTNATNATKDAVPKSCCKNEKGCQHTELDTQGTGDIYTDGCNKKVVDFMEENFTVIGGVSIAFCFLMLFGAFLACCLARQVNKANYQDIA